MVMTSSLPTGVPEAGRTEVTTHGVRSFARSVMMSWPSGAIAATVKQRRASVITSFALAPMRSLGMGWGQVKPVQPLGGTDGPTGA